MGEVFLAEHVTIGTRVAIKVLQAQISKDQEQVNRFFNEAKAVSKVRHAGPVKIFDCGYHLDPNNQRVAYLAMEFLEGESLASRIKRLGTLPAEQVADVGRQIAGVLDAVHTAGITHRDLKPDNIFLCPDHELPSGERVKVLDFGIAKLTGTMAGPQTKGTMGTPAYMAPEQWNNSSSVDGRADCYSLGCVMYEMAVGRPPFPAQSIGEACNHHLNSKPPRASEGMRAIPPEFDSLVDRMLSKTVDQRPTIKEVARAFDTLRTSGATQRWQAASVSSVAATIAPDVLGSQPNLGLLGSQPAISAQYGSQPGPVSGQYGSQPNLPSQGYPLGHQPGMQNPLMTPQHDRQPAQYPAQPGPSASYPQQFTPQHEPAQPFTPQHQPAQPFTPQHQPAPHPFTPQHPTPAPQHQTPQQFTPQHQTPLPQQFTPQHQTPQHAPPATKSNKGLLIAIGAVVLVGGGVAAAVVATSGGDGTSTGSGTTAGPDKPGPDKPGPDKPGPDKPGPDKPTIGRGAVTPDAATVGAITPDAATVEPPQPVVPKRDQILAKNAFVDRGGVRVLSSQITAAEYELVLGKLPDGITKPADAEAPVASLTQQEAAAFCTAIDAHLPTSEEWEKASRGAWGIAVDAVAGPLQEWTSTIKDELVVVRGGHAAMVQAQLDKAARSKPPYFLQKEPAGASFDRKIVSSPTIGFRCVDGKATASAEAPPAKIGTGFGFGGGRGGNAKIGAGTATGKGTLDRAVIQAGIKNRFSHIQFCYERELLKRPGLEGKIAVSFTISSTGAVSSASATGFDATVATCVATVIKSVRFPAPSGGGSVQVNYPFIFKPTD